MKHIRTSVFVLLAILIINGCQKEYSVENNGSVTHTGTWQFNDSTKLFSGNMDSAYVEHSTSLNTQIFHLLGTSLDGSQKFNLELYADTFKTGTYKASLFQSTFLYTSGSKNIYQAGQLTGEFIVNITSLTANNISGTFSGSSLDSSGNLKQLTLGKFTSTLNNSGSGTGGTVSSGVLGDSSGNCKPVVLAGTYAQGLALTSANTVQVQVTVAVAGTYTITTNTVNGVTFSNSGTFTSTGAQTVTLTGSGTPSSSGVQDFKVSYGNSQCSFAINFLTLASGTLGALGGNCTPFAIAGIYQQGIPLAASNTVQIQVNVTSPGSYNIKTDSVNGVVFSNSGTFSNTGPQSITLTGSGTPTNAGAQTFAVTFGTSSCSFSITFLQGVMPSGDYFPLTLNSNWAYDFAVDGMSQDSIRSVVIGYAPVFGSSAYNTIASYQIPSSVPFDSSYYRKPGGDYYQYTNYSNSFQFDQSVSGEFIFLKDTVPSGTSWSSPKINGTIGGVAVSGSIKMTILDKAVSVTLGGFNFPDVIKVKYEYFLAASPTPIETDERWFAKNVGQIYESLNVNASTYTSQISSYQVF